MPTAQQRSFACAEKLKCAQLGWRQLRCRARKQQTKKVTVINRSFVCDEERACGAGSGEEQIAAGRDGSAVREQ